VFAQVLNWASDELAVYLVGNEYGKVAFDGSSGISKRFTSSATSREERSNKKA
jgi:hypothetical protein